MKKFTYKGAKTNEISFPLGGIGTGCIGLSGHGSLIDWEINNRPNKGSTNGYSHFAIKAEAEGKILDARILNGDTHPPYMGDRNRLLYTGYGHGYDCSTMAGFPHFKEVVFEGTYPIAKLKFMDESFPGKVSMTAFNPFIPINDLDSSIPGAFFEIEVENILRMPVTYSIAISICNSLAIGPLVNKHLKSDQYDMLQLSSAGIGFDQVEYGDLCMATDAEDTSYLEYWLRGVWCGKPGNYWREFIRPGKLQNRTYPTDICVKNPILAGNEMATLAAHIEVQPHEKKKTRFIITWNFPNRYNYWNPEVRNGEDGSTPSKPKSWKNHYALQYENSTASASYSLNNWHRLYAETLSFKNALFSSSLPADVLDAISANLSTLKSPTCLRLEDGSFYGFEGCHFDTGSCEGSCTHVWNYAYALPFLFPKLERSMRDLDYKYNQNEDRGMAYRLQLPLGRERALARPCADGQFGGVIKTYREWKISGDNQWLQSNWEAVKKSIEYAWSSTNVDKWDIDKNGVLEGRQDQTMDAGFIGPNSWITGYYLAALKAGACMAIYFGEEDTAALYMNLFKRGKAWVESNLFNGEFYQQKIDLKDCTILEQYGKGKDPNEVSATELYWNEETEEIRYQIGEGCEVNQVIAQWHANLCGLGEIFDNKQVKKTLQSIYKYNFKRNMRHFANSARLFALNDEAGVVNCVWPDGTYKPYSPELYADEVWCGCEYQIAAHMIQEGLIQEGIEIVRAVRSRFDGEKRNPWNEFECGSNYARSMASYALLNAFSGFDFDMVNKSIGFNPVFLKDKKFKCFWSLESGFGTFESTPGRAKVRIINGKLEIKRITLPYLQDCQIECVHLGGKPVDFTAMDGILEMKAKITINKSSSLDIKYRLVGASVVDA